VREVAYGEIPRAARSDKHRRAADWLGALARDRGDDHAEVLAHHLEAAMTYGAAAGLAMDDLRPRLVEALRDAGDRARALSNVSRAVAYYQRAIEASPERPDPELLLLHAEAATWAHGVEAGTAVLEEAAAALLAAGRNELAAQALTFLERALWRSGHPDLSLLDRALELVSGMGPTPVRGRVLSAVAVRWAISGRANEALPLAHEALEIARAHGDRTDEAEALTNAAVVEVNAGNLFGGLETAREGLELALECGTSYLPRLYNNLASFEYSVGDLAAAGQYIREGLALAERLGTGGIVDALTAALAGDYFDAGRWDEALELVRTLIGKHLGGGTPHYSDPSLQLIEAAIVLAREGQLPARMLDDVLRAARTIGDPQVVIPALADAAALQAAAGRVDEAVALLSEYREALQADPSWQNEGTHQVTAVIAWRELMGEPVPEEVLRGSPVPWVEAARLVADGRAIAAADALAAIGARTLEAQVRLHAARTAAQAGHELAEAARQLDLATDFWRSVGATAQLAQVDEVRALTRAAAS
jgi:tetratricopeptide (TPR) repeat protein